MWIRLSLPIGSYRRHRARDVEFFTAKRSAIGTFAAHPIGAAKEHDDDKQTPYRDHSALGVHDRIRPRIFGRRDF
jgi:hypothetical protein